MKRHIRRNLWIGSVLVLALSAAWPSEATAGEDASGSSPDPAPSESSESAPTSDEEPISLADALAGTSGVRVATMCTNCNVANVTMLGQSGERVQVWQDGLPVEGGLGAIYLLSIMPSQGIAKTDVLRGAGSVLSGAEASVGAVVLRTRASEKRPYLYASLDGGTLSWQGQKLLASRQWGRFGGQVAYTHASSDGSDPDRDGNFDLGAFDRNTLGGTLTWTMTKRSLLRLDALNYREEQRGSKGGYWTASPTGFLKEDIDIRRDEFSLAWDYTLEHGSRLTLRARHARREQDTSDDYPGEQNPYMQVLETVQALETRYQMPIAGGHALTFGADMKRLEVRGDTVKTSVIFPGGQELNDFVRRKGVFAEMEFSLPMHLALTAGLRYDDLDWTPGLPPLPEDLWPYAPGWEGTPERTRSRVSPRARVAWKASPKLSLSLSAGAAVLAPAPGFERVCCGAVALSNAFSAAETSTNYLLDADYVPWRWWKVRVSLLRSDYSDYLQKMAIFTAPDYTPSFARVSYTDFALEGAELATEMRFFDRLSYGFEWTHLRVKSRGPVRLKPLGPFDFGVILPEEMIPFQPQDQGSAFVRWDDQARGLGASAQVQYTGRMFVQVLGQTGGVDRFGFDKTTALWIVNLRVQQRLHKGLSGYVGVDNLTNKVQTNLSDPRYEYNWGPLRGRYYYAGLSFEM